MDRDKNVGAASFSSDADRVDHIASVFPFVFFLVAALVALTTMTRMVEEERSLIGTYKALGYGTGRIVSKYLIYAGIASVLGSVVGIAVLSQVLPKVIYGAYSIVYFVPETAYPIDWPIAIIMAVGAWFGGYCGSFLQRKKGNKFIENFISVCSIALAIYLVVDLIV